MRHVENQGSILHTGAKIASKRKCLLKSLDSELSRHTLCKYVQNIKETLSKELKENKKIMSH